MVYYLTKNWALRGWQDRMICLFNLANPLSSPVPINFSDFELLMHCDGISELPDSERLQFYLQKGIVAQGSHQISEEQNYQYFPYVHRSSVKLSVTDRCNYRCRHCYAGDEKGRMNGEISLELFQSLVRQMNEMGIHSMSLTGGEPLLHPQIHEMLRCLSQNHIYLKKIYTNGTYLTESFLDSLTALKLHPAIQVSFDGYGIHDWMRGVQGAEQDALRALQLLKDKNQPIHVGINVNGRTAPTLIDTCRRLVHDYHPVINVYYTSPVPRWLACSTEEDQLDFGAYCDLCIELSRLCIEEQWGVKLVLFQFPALKDRRSFERFSRSLHSTAVLPDSVKLMDCPEACGTVHITNDGRVLPCAGYEGTTQVEGFFCGEDINLNKRSLADILTDSSYLLSFRPTIGDLKKKEESCAACEWVSKCRGGCRLLSLDRYRSHPEFDRKSEVQCLYFRGGYAEKYDRVLTEAFKKSNCEEFVNC